MYIMPVTNNVNYTKKTPFGLKFNELPPNLQKGLEKYKVPFGLDRIEIKSAEEASFEGEKVIHVGFEDGQGRSFFPDRKKNDWVPWLPW